MQSLLLSLSGLTVLLIMGAIALRYSALTERDTRVSRQERIILLMVLLWGVCTVYGSFLVGESYFAYRDTGVDTVDLYVPFYIDLIDSVSSGTFGAWNFDYGLGASVLSYQSWLLDPFNVLLVPLGLLFGVEKLSLILVFVQSVKIILAGFVFDCLLVRYCETPLARILGSVCYALCGFIVLWGQHYWIGGVVPLFAFMLLGLERLMERWTVGRFSIVVATSALSVGWSPYIGFMVLLCAAVYALMRLIHQAGNARPVREVLCGTGVLLVPVLCGCLIACITLVPYALYLFGETARTASGGVSTLDRAISYAGEFVPLNWVPVILSRLIGDGLVTSGGAYPETLLDATASFPVMNCYEFVSLGFGALSIVLLGQFAHWVAKDAAKRDKALISIAIFLVVLYCLNSFLPALLNLLVAPKFRSSFALAVPVCIAMAIGWERRIQARRIARAPLVTSACLTVAILGWSFVHTVDGRRLVVLSAACLIAFVCVAYGVSVSQRHGDGLLVSMAALLVVGAVVIDAYLVTNNRVACVQQDFPGQMSGASESTREALAYIEQIDPSLYRVEKTYAISGLYNDALVEGYHGVNAYNSTGDGDVSEFYSKLWPAAVSSFGSVQNFWNDPDGGALLSQMGVRYLFSKDKPKSPYFEPLRQFGDVTVYKNRNEVPIFSCAGDVVTESRADALDTAHDRRTVLDRGVIVPEHVEADLSALELNPTYHSDLALEHGQIIEGAFTVSGGAVARLSIPYSPGWTVEVDGNEVDTFRVDYGFVGFVVSEGEHTLKAQYRLPGFRIGAAMSLVGFALALLSCAVATRSSRRSRKEP